MHLRLLVIKINASEFRNFLFSVMYVPLSAVNFVLQTESENVEPITGRYGVKCQLSKGY